MDRGLIQMILGAALGAFFDMLLTTVVDATKKVCGFTTHLHRLQSTLSSINPAIDDIETLDMILDRPRHATEALTARLTEAEQLVRRCSVVSKWNVLMRLYYSDELSSFETTLSRIFLINAAALQLCERKMVSVDVGDLQEMVNQVANGSERKLSEIGVGVGAGVGVGVGAGNEGIVHTSENIEVCVC